MALLGKWMGLVTTVSSTLCKKTDVVLTSKGVIILFPSEGVCE